MRCGSIEGERKNEREIWQREQQRRGGEKRNMDTEKRKGEGEGREIWIDLREQEVRTEKETFR